MDEKMAHINERLSGIIKPEGIEAWWHVNIPALGNRTATKAIEDGDIDKVIAVVESYYDFSYG